MQGFFQRDRLNFQIEESHLDSGRDSGAVNADFRGGPGTPGKKNGMLGIDTTRLE